jgi:NitT/TauT family transport system ATP-binding protein
MKLSLQHITKQYSLGEASTLVLDDIDLEVHSGEVLVLVGPNGSGKTTLLQIAAGVMTPTTGRVQHTVENVCVDDASIALLWQDYRQSNFPWLNALDNAALSGQFGRRDIVAARARARALLQQLVPDVRADAPIHHLSGGQQQMVALVRALVARPKALIADEPLSAIDQARRWMLVAAVENWWVHNPIPMLWASHDIDEAIWLANRIALLSASQHRIVEILPVDVARPRSVDTLTNHVHLEARRRIVDFLHSEEQWLLKAQSMEMSGGHSGSHKGSAD